MNEKITSKVNIYKLCRMIEELNVDSEKETNEIAKDIEKLKLKKKAIIKKGVKRTAVILVGVTIITTLMEEGMFIGDETFLEECLPNIIITAGGIYGGIHLIPYILPFIEIERIEEEIYGKNSELKPIKKPRRLGSKTNIE